MEKLFMLLCTFAAGLLLSQGILGQKQYLEIYEKNFASESSWSLNTSYNEKDLRNYTSLNITRNSAHYWRWRGGGMFYQQPNFGGEGSYVSYRGELGSGMYTMDGLMSFRFAGNVTNALQDTLTLYEFPRWAGEEMAVITKNEPSITVPFASIYNTGNTYWTLYTKINYSGFSICLSAGPYANIEDFGLLPGLVKSIRIGCSSKQMYSPGQREAEAMIYST